MSANICQVLRHHITDNWEIHILDIRWYLIVQVMQVHISCEMTAMGSDDGAVLKSMCI